MMTDTPLILDGGLATELARRGHDISGKLWAAPILRTDPQANEQGHHDEQRETARAQQVDGPGQDRLDGRHGPSLARPGIRTRIG